MAVTTRVSTVAARRSLSPLVVAVRLTVAASILCDRPLRLVVITSPAYDVVAVITRPHSPSRTLAAASRRCKFASSSALIGGR